MWIGSLGPRMFWGTRATNFSIYTTKMEGSGPKILGTGAKFKQVPCQKNCRVNRAVIAIIFSARAEKGARACVSIVFSHLSKLSHGNWRFAPGLKLTM